MILLLACGVDPGPAVDPARTVLPPPPELPCPWTVGSAEVVGRAPVPGPEALRPAEDHLWLGGRLVQGPGRIAQVDEDAGTVWVAARAAGLRALDASGATVLERSLGAPVVAVDAAGGEAWAASADGEVVRMGLDGERWRGVVDGRPTAIRAAGEGAWVRGADRAWRPVGRPDPRVEEPEPELPPALVVVGLTVGPEGAIADTATEVVLPDDLGRVDDLPWQTPVALAERDGWTAVGLGQLGRLVLVDPGGVREVHPLPGPMEDVRDPLPPAALRWDGDGLWIPLPRHGLLRMPAPGADPVVLRGVPGAWDVAGAGPERVVALGDLGVGLLRDGALVGRCPLPGRVVRVAVGEGRTFAASRGVVYELLPVR